MSLPQVTSRGEWLVARKELLAEEKAMTRARDALNTKRRELPMVKVDKGYVFEGPGRKASLLDLFDHRRQLIIQHFMFDPSWDDGCPSCSFAAVFHTYSTYARGAEQTGGSYYWLDLTALGRQEDWEEPKGRAAAVRRAVPDFAE